MWEWFKTYGHVAASFGGSVMISLATTLIVFLSIIIVTSKYDRRRILNRLTLLPLYTCIAFCIGIIVQICILIASNAYVTNLFFM